MLSSELIETLSSHFVRRVNAIHVEGDAQFMLGWTWFNHHCYDQNQEQLLSSNLTEAFSKLAVKRKAEYLAGRQVALCLFKYSGLNEFSLARNDNGAPGWPPDYVGSISHTADVAVAILACKQQHQIAGIDVENIFDTNMLNQVKSYITTDNEFVNIRDKLSAAELTDEQLGTLIFSAKESLFKALNPVVNMFFDFSAAVITDIKTMDGLFTIRLTRDLGEHWSENTTLRGRYLFAKGKVLTLLIQ